jgi:soluble lytic murein transglycosylase-like protein
MVIPTCSVSSSDRLRILRRLESVWPLVFALLAACRAAPPPPRLADAIRGNGPPGQRARAFLRVACEGPPGERSRAAFLWGVYACDAGSAQAAVEAFALASPRDGLGRLAAHRLEDTLIRSGGSVALWSAAARSDWLEPHERAELQVAAAEHFVSAGDADAATRLLPPEQDLSSDLRLRALAVLAKAGGKQRATVRDVVACTYPERFGDLFPDEPVTRVLRAVSQEDRLRRAEAWLAAGHPEDALREAGRLGSPGALLAARAALQMRRPQTALLWAERAGAGATSWEVRGEAYRLQAWIASGRARRNAFERMREAAAKAARLAASGSDVGTRATLLEAEALTELHRFAAAARLLAGAGVRDLPRWEWVWRRLVFLQGAGGEVPIGLDLARESGSVRDTRLAAYWKAVTSAGASRSSQLDQLASSGFPDLPALWAARRLARDDVPVALDAAPLDPVSPPAWVSDLMDLGRVGDVVLAWRAALQAGAAPSQQWLGLVQLADYPAIDAIPLVLRAEPRLLAGPWNGLPRALLEMYLPLPFRTQVERAAHDAGIPPWVLAGVVRQESAWNPRARSPAGALGLTQVLPGTARDIARWGGRRNLAGYNLFEPETNLTLGALHLAQWFSRYRSWTVALACHNAGERRIREIWEEAGETGGPEFVERLEIPETWDYVHRVVLWSEGYRLLYWPEGRAYPWT